LLGSVPVALEDYTFMQLGDKRMLDLQARAGKNTLIWCKQAALAKMLEDAPKDSGFSILGRCETVGVWKERKKFTFS
jgi:hypothetical protein